MQTLLPTLLTQIEMMKFLKVTKPTIIKLRKDGHIPYLKIGSIIRYDFDAVMKAFKKRKK